MVYFIYYLHKLPVTINVFVKLKQRTILPNASSTGLASIARSTGRASIGDIGPVLH